MSAEELYNFIKQRIKMLETINTKTDMEEVERLAKICELNMLIELLNK